MTFDSRLSIRIAVHLASWLPALLLVYGAINQTLGADPQDVLLHETGLWALQFLLLSLFMTPLQRWFSASRAVLYRRALGLYALFYMLCHLVIFLWFFVGWDINWFFEEVKERPYIFAGLLAITLMLPLAATSTKGMQRRLGRRWKALHQLVYPIAILAIAHFIWQSKSDLNRPLLYAIVLLALFSIRVWWFWLKKRPQKRGF